MKKQISFALTLLIAISLLLGACAPAATPTAAPAEPTTAPAEPTAAPVEPTAAPTEVPAPDYTALFTSVIAGIPAEKGNGAVPAVKLNEELVDNPPFLVDVREPAELEKDGYIEGAVNIPIRSLLENLDKLPGLDEPIVIYCGSGHRGGYAIAALRALGYTNVRNLGGGIGAWKKANLPVVTGSLPEAPTAGEAPALANPALLPALQAFFAEMPDSFYAINAAKLNETLAENDALTLIDVRSQEEWDNSGYIDGALHLPFDEFMASLDQIPAEKDAPIVIYCASGHRGSIIAMALRMLGYTDVSNLGGGLNAWKAAELPVAGWVDWNKTWTDFLTNLPEDMHAVSAANLNTELADTAPFLVDLREPGEVEETGTIEGAVNIPFRQLTQSLDKLPALDEPIVVYCASGHRGGMAVATLRLLGYTDVRNLGGGIGAWKKAELPLVEGAPAPAESIGAPEVDQTVLRGLDTFVANLPDGFYTVKATDLNTELAEKELFLLDVRTPGEVEKTGIIEGSVTIPVTELMGKLDQLPTDKAAPIVVLCASGHRGGMVMQALRMLGYTDVRNLAGGINAWIAAELPVAQPVAP